LMTKDGAKSTEEVLSGKTAIGIYFSAHWCPPCRGFTPKLAEMYTNAFEKKGMAIVFASSDKDDAAFKDYYGEQPWYALPFEKKDLKEKLSKKYKVQGIPSFVIIDPEGKTITTDGRAAVSKDPEGANYPWFPPTAADKAKAVLDTLGPELVAKTAGKPIGLYFSAHWCPPCRGFTPKLAQIYNDGLKDKMEIIFISSDRDEAAFKEYAAEMPWPALPFAKRAEKESLSDSMGVQGIPSFIICNSDGTVVTTDGRSKVMSDPKAENFPAGWLPQPFNDVNDDPSDLNEQRCVIAMGSDDSMKAAVKAVAEEKYQAANKSIDDMPERFFSGPDGDVMEQLRNMTKVTGNKLVVLDIPEGGAFYVCEPDPKDAAAIKAFLADIEAGKAEKKQLSKQ